MRDGGHLIRVARMLATLNTGDKATLPAAHPVVENTPASVRLCEHVQPGPFVTP